MLSLVLGAGLEPASLSAYAPQTYVSAIPPPERRGSKLSADGNRWQVSTEFFLATIMLLLAIMIEITTTGVKVVQQKHEHD